MELAESRFPLSDTRPPRDESHLGIAVDLSKCIHCMRCVQACREVEVNGVVGMAGRGPTMHVVFDFGDPMGTVRRLIPSEPLHSATGQTYIKDQA